MVAKIDIKSYENSEIGAVVSLLTKNGYTVKFSRKDSLTRTIIITKGVSDGQDIPVAHGRNDERPSDR